MSLLRIEAEGHSLEPGLEGVIKDAGEIPKVGQRGTPQGQLPSPTWEAALSKPSLLAPQGISGCDGYTFTLPFPPTLACLFF